MHIPPQLLLLISYHIISKSHSRLLLCEHLFFARLTERSSIVVTNETQKSVKYFRAFWTTVTVIASCVLAFAAPPPSPPLPPSILNHRQK